MKVTREFFRKFYRVAHKNRTLKKDLKFFEEFFNFFQAFFKSLILSRVRLPLLSKSFCPYDLLKFLAGAPPPNFGALTALLVEGESKIIYHRFFEDILAILKAFSIIFFKILQILSSIRVRLSSN